MSERKTYKLGELGTFIGGVSSIKKEDYGHGTPFLPYKNIYKNSKVNINELELMNVKPAELQRRGCVYGDIFFTASSETPDEVAMSSVLLDKVKNLTFNGFCKRYRLHDFNTLLPEYARYLFRSPSFRREVYQVATGDIRFNISQESLGKIEVEIPKIESQKELATILTSIDDRIELNILMNQTLESMAHAIFKEWFINYNFPGFDGQLVDDLPKGWRVGPIGTFITVQNGFAFKSSDFKSKGVHGVVKIKNIANNVVDIVNLQFISDDIVKNTPSRFKISSGDLLIAMTGAEVGKVGFVPNTDRSLWLNQRVGMFKEKISHAKWFCYLILSSAEYQSILLSTASGSAQPNISSSQIENTEIVVPEPKLIELFGEVVHPIFERVLENYYQNEILTQTRDSLLPKLLSGKIKVR